MEKLVDLLRLVAEWGVGGAVAGFVAWLLFLRGFPSYVTEKFKNLATKEDARDLTELVKDVEHRYNALLEELKVKNQLRVAAIDRRLQAHQEAFTMWRALTAGDSFSVGQCQEWWENNCVYLEPEVRDAFVDAYVNEAMRREFVQIGAEAARIVEASSRVHAFPDILFEAVKLPPLSKDERGQLPKA